MIGWVGKFLALVWEASLIVAVFSDRGSSIENTRNGEPFDWGLPLVVVVSGAFGLGVAVLII